MLLLLLPSFICLLLPLSNAEAEKAAFDIEKDLTENRKEIFSNGKLGNSPIFTFHV